MGGIGPVQIIVILVIVLLLFGTKKLRNIGGDLGGAIKGFKQAMREGESDDDKKSESDPAQLEKRDETASTDKTEQKDKSQS